MSEATATEPIQEIRHSMLKIENILCPTDFSDFSAKAYDYAYSLARRYGSRLFVEHVIQPVTYSYSAYAFPESMTQLQGELSEYAHNQLKELVKAHARNGVQAEVGVHTGPVAESILASAERHSADLIVMGTHGRRGFDRLALGSVTEHILRRAKCPVLVVRRPLHDFVANEKDQDPVHLRKILFATDFSGHSNRALTYALSLATEYNAELTLMHVLEDFAEAAELKQATTAVISELERPIPAEARNWCAIKTSVRVGQPFREIIQLALESQTDLIVMGVRGRNALDLALFGSTTQRVIQFGPCPVLVIHI